MTLAEMFEAASDEFLKFDRIENPKHPAPDLCAFLMLHELAPTRNVGNGEVADMISAAEHDEFYLSTDCDKLAEVATPEIIRDLHRCGVRYDEDYDCLCMFA